MNRKGEKIGCSLALYHFLPLAIELGIAAPDKSDSLQPASIWLGFGLDERQNFNWRR